MLLDEAAPVTDCAGTDGCERCKDFRVAAGGAFEYAGIEFPDNSTHRQSRGLVGRSIKVPTMFFGRGYAKHVKDSHTWAHHTGLLL